MRENFVNYFYSELHNRWFEFCNKKHRMPPNWITSVWHLMHGFYQLPEGLRHYHTLYGHIYDCLQIFDEYKTDLPSSYKSAKYWFEIEYSLWMHDLFYYADLTVNELMSATIADKLLYGFEAIDASIVRRAIIDTGLALPPVNYVNKDDLVSLIVCDIDLVGLSKPYEEFMEDGNRIRKEYSHISDEDFKQGRKDFFEKLYARGYVYRLPYFKEKYEKQAKDNIVAYISDGRLAPV